MKDGIRAEYVRKQLHMRDAYGYFQAGVLVMNLDRTRKIHTVHEWLQIASKPGYIYNDQDILNTECEGLVTYLDYSWNVMHNCAGRVAGVFDFAPADVYKAYMESRKAPKVVHYAGFDKLGRILVRFRSTVLAVRAGNSVRCANVRRHVGSAEAGTSGTS